VDEKISLGDFVMSNGDLAALSIFDAVVRLKPGVLGNSMSLSHESHNSGRLESSNYTRPENYKGLKVPKILQSGNHEEIHNYKIMDALIKTLELRPDLLINNPLSAAEKKLLRQKNERKEQQS
jgi:tRNA (guanine37-N1)-methyltransferase